MAGTGTDGGARLRRRTVIGAGGRGRLGRAEPRAAASGVDPLLLLRRATYGPTPASVADITARGTTAWLERQLAPATIPDPVADQLVARFPTLGWTPLQLHAAVTNKTLRAYDHMLDISRSTTARAVWGERQLLEVMVDFWSNHLNVTCPSERVWDVRWQYDRDVVRRHALGTFADLLTAAICHPAMLRYLTNDTSTKKQPNENLGRELLELHTLGVAAGYTEADVLDAARALTGMSVEYGTGAFVYKPTSHWTGPIRVFGFEHPNTVAADGQTVVRALTGYLARRPETARHVCRKLAVRFVSDAPSDALVERLVQTWAAHDTAIAPVLRTLFSSGEFAASAGQKVRRPAEDLVATLRTLGTGPDASGVTGLHSLQWKLYEAGHQVFSHPTPDGYADVATRWSSPAVKLLQWNWHMNLAAAYWPATLQHPPLRRLLPATLPSTHGALVDALARRLLFQPLTGAQITALCTFLGETPSSPVSTTSKAAGPWLPMLVALVLDTPQHALR